ncbi:hypothetical protein JKP75_18635 [Blastococcus sp. TML/M2B]|uniref:hypothetical protein n=1 Tax=unclassified Blastococcus TaxID=2619396 RepID=UPI00190DD196|nr:MULTISPECIES: hypothetical protein [unclassified Blastococcus]MBN1094381.1 hypothetical protein [Blastococcus sp. TML/M2B]MBN1095342.1 hypothetical protein [Blastococcus sp. TML/C7B]
MTTVLTSPAPSLGSSVEARRTGPSLPTLVGLEMRKSLSHRSGRAFAASAALLGPVGVALAATDAEFGWAAGPIGIVGSMTGLVLLALGVISTAGEWTHRTVQTTFLLVPQRGRVLAAKTAAVAVLGATLAAVSAGSSLAVIAAVGVDDLNWDGTGQALVTAVGAGAAFAVIGAGAGAATANTPAALTSLYLLIMGVLPLVRIWNPDLAQWLDPAEATTVLAQGDAEARSIAVLAGWVVVASVAGWVLTSRRPVQ